ncbi:MAG: type VI secretion system protein TssA [Myxococcota bacterium]|nr:type VI secretion system protein TssA [Myxococcota bacterium]
MLDTQSLLRPAALEGPGGPNLEYTAEYAALDRAAQGRAERQLGETIVPAEGPDWPSVIEKAAALLTVSKDLRVATQLARALLATDGFAGLAEGLTLVRQLVGEYWAVLHPRIEEDDNDPTARINAMASLTHRDMLQAIRVAPLVKSRVSGVITLRDVEGVANQKDGAPPTPRPSSLRDVPANDVVAAAHAAERCGQAAEELEALWISHAGSAGPDFSDLRRLLAKASLTLKAQIDAGGAPPELDGEREDRPASDPLVRGEPRSREEVVRALDAVCAYYARHEPSSPVPLLLERCKRLVTMSFLDIVKDMVPDGLSTIQTIAGKKGD